MSTVRLRRLAADFERLSDFVRRHPRLQLVQSEGDPPERYQLEFRIRSLRQVQDEMVEVKSHLVEISLPRNYPRSPPLCRMLTPIFHPNIAPHAICIGDHWSAGEPLSSIVARIGEMIAYQSYNTKSPLNGEAARWVDQNLERLPLDGVSMVLEDDPDAGPATIPVAASPVTAPVERPAPQPAEEDDGVTVAPVAPRSIVFQCSGCGAKFTASADKAGKRARCPAVPGGDRNTRCLKMRVRRVGRAHRNENGLAHHNPN